MIDPRGVILVLDLVSVLAEPKVKIQLRLNGSRDFAGERTPDLSAGGRNGRGCRRVFARRKRALVLVAASRIRGQVSEISK